MFASRLCLLHSNLIKSHLGFFKEELEVDLEN